MSKKTLAVLGASLLFAACTNPFVMKKEVPAPMPIPEAISSAMSAPVAATGAMMQSSSSVEGMMKSAPAAMEKVDAMKK